MLTLVDNQTWGDWRFDASDLTLKCDNISAGGYYIDLEDIHTAADILDWILHLGGAIGKTWVTPIILSDFIRALEYLFEAQRTFCGRRAVSSIDPASFINARTQ